MLFDMVQYATDYCHEVPNCSKQFIGVYGTDYATVVSLNISTDNTETIFLAVLCDILHSYAHASNVNLT